VTFDRLNFWRDPESQQATAAMRAFCRPEFYLDKSDVTQGVVDALVRNGVTPDMSIIELGSGTGRNLMGLIQSGYNKVYGLDISQAAIDVGREQWPELNDVPTICSPIEQAIGLLSSYDVIYTQGLFMHLDYSVDWIFPVIANKARRLLMTIEVEQWRGERPHCWMRNYGDIFTGLGWHEVESRSCGRVKGWTPLTIMRVFKRYYG
jgi:SAM-dependent methyltransferase